MTGTPKTRSDLLCDLRSVRDKVAHDFGIDIFGLGGSQASGTARYDSDIDIAVRKLRPIHLGVVLDAKFWLEEKFNHQVDLVFVDSLPEYKREIFSKSIVSLL